ncbi:MAG: recombinase family protein, partial [Hungatella sp.]
VQRQLVLDYISKQEDWVMDDKEYFEGSSSGYKISVENRDTLQEALKDAENYEYDVLVCYKDDRIGRRMWEIGAYVMKLKQLGVDIYTVKDGCISPQTDDIMGQMMLALRYGNAQKSSSDTGMRVKDTAQKLVQTGKFMGGKAPYGYELIYSGEISKHGRALKKLQIIDEQAELIKVIYDLSVSKELGSSKIASILNDEKKYLKMAPNDFWKSGTITSILTNPIYAGYTAYKRREKINGKIKNLKDGEWILSKEKNDSIQIIDEDIWNLVQKKRKIRSKKYTEMLENQNVTIMKKNDGNLPLIDVIYCGYCGSKLTNGTKYNYWTMKETGERRVSKSGFYKCQSAWSGIPHDKKYMFKQEEIEPIIFNDISEYLDELRKNNNITEEINKSKSNEITILESSINELNRQIGKIKKGIDIMESHIPDAITGEYALSLDELATAIRKKKAEFEEKEADINKLEEKIEWFNMKEKQKETIRNLIYTWKDIFFNSDKHTQRVLINKMVKRIDITAESIEITYRIKIDDF